VGEAVASPAGEPGLVVSEHCPVNQSPQRLTRLLSVPVGQARLTAGIQYRVVKASRETTRPVSVPHQKAGAVAGPELFPAVMEWPEDQAGAEAFTSAILHPSHTRVERAQVDKATMAEMAVPLVLPALPKTGA